MKIGQFTLAKNGTWVGSIRTLTIDSKVRLVPNDNRVHDNAPAYRVFVGEVRVGEAWGAQTGGSNPRSYLRIRLDDPSLPKPLRLTLLPTGGDAAQLFWSRRRGN